jgi:hypothetical protein
MKKLIVCLVLLAFTGIVQAAPDKLIGSWESYTNEGWQDHLLNANHNWAPGYIDDPEIFGDEATTPRYWWEEGWKTEGFVSLKILAEPKTQANGWGQRAKIDVHTDILNYSKLEFDVKGVTAGTVVKIEELIYSGQTNGWATFAGSEAAPFVSMVNGDVKHVTLDYSAFKTSAYMSATDGYGSFIFTLTSDNASSYVYLDNVMLTPEPATIGLLGLGGLALLRRKR